MMATNLVSLVMLILTPDMIAKIASALGLDRDVVQKAIRGAVPALLSSLAGLASTPNGARQLSNVLTQQNGSLESFKNLIGPTRLNAFADTGSNMLSGLLGGGALDALRQAVGNFAGVGEGASRSLLGMLGPVVVGALSQQQRSAGLDASGLASLLTSQKQQIVASIPSGLADQLNAAGLLDTSEGGLRGRAEASDAVSRMRAAAGRTVPGAVRTASASRDVSPSQWPYWLAALVLLGGLGWYFVGRPGRDTVAELPRTTAPAGQGTGTVGMAPPDLTVGNVNLVNQVNSSVGSLRTALAGITDTASAQAALPRIQEATVQLNEVGTLAAKLPVEQKTALANLIATAMPTINPLFEKVLAIPGVDSIARPAIDAVRGKLDALVKA